MSSLKIRSNNMMLITFHNIGRNGYKLLKVAPYTFIIGGLVPNLEFSRENVKNICKNKYNFFSLKSEPQVMFILMF